MADCPNCEYHKDRAARWRAEAYKQAIGQGRHHVIELPWVGLTDAEKESLWEKGGNTFLIEKVEALLKEKNT